MKVVTVGAAMVMGVALSAPARADDAPRPGPSDDGRSQAAAEIRGDAKAERDSPQPSPGAVVGIDLASIAILSMGNFAGFSAPSSCLYSTTAACKGGESMNGIGTPAYILGGAGYALGAPIVHWVRGQTGLGFASLGLHLAGAAAGEGVFAAVFNGQSGNEATGALLALPLLAVPMLIDAVWMNGGRRPRDWSSEDSKTSWVPTLKLRQSGAVAGMDVIF